MASITVNGQVVQIVTDYPATDTHPVVLRDGQVWAVPSGADWQIDSDVTIPQKGQASQKVRWEAACAMCEDVRAAYVLVVSYFCSRDWRTDMIVANYNLAAAMCRSDRLEVPA